MIDFNNFKIWFEKKLKEENLFFETSFVELIYKNYFQGLRSVSKPKIIALGGGPGAGKTTYRKTHLALGLANNYNVHDMDETLIHVPGYQEIAQKEGAKKAFESCWRVAQRVTDIMMNYAIQNKLNIIYDRTLGSEGSYLSLQEAKELGYLIKLYGFYVTEETALMRVQQREISDCRVVTPDIVSEYLHRFSTLWPCYLKIANEATLFDNNGLECVKIFSTINNKSTTLNYLIYNKFLSTKYKADLAAIKFPNVLSLQDDVIFQDYQSKKANYGLFFTPTKMKSNLEVCALSKKPELIKKIALWVEEKWGYIRGFPGMAYRTKAISSLQNNFYVLIYAKQLIGMFALFEYDSFNEKIKAKELMYVYLDENFRGLGIGKFIIEVAKRKCSEQGANMVVLDTLNENLNHLYEKCGAKIVCDGQLLTHPTSVLRIKI